MATALLVGVTIGLDRAETPVLACGPFPEYPLFTSTRAPEDVGYYSGRLGIVQPRYERRYLLVAWRTLKGAPLTPAERAAFTGQPDDPAAVPIPTVDPVQVWLQARRRVAGAGGPTAIPREIFIQASYRYVLNCGDSAFLTAASTLTERADKHQYSHEELRNWVETQDLVFDSCGGRDITTGRVPSSLGPGQSTLARADREYQIAAATFYRGRFAEAEAAFTAIAADTASPWHEWGAYLAARAMIREGTMGGKDAVGDPAALTRAEHALEAILADSSETTRGPAQQLLQFVRLRLHPVEALGESARSLQIPESDPRRFARHLGDFLWLMDRLRPEDATRLSDVDIVDWMRTLKGQIDDPATHAFERWETSRQDAWLLAALVMATPKSPRAQAMIEAAAGFTSRSPAYPTLAFHRARLLLLSGAIGPARRVLDEALAEPRLAPSAINQLRSARIQTARNLDEFLTDAVRSPVQGWIDSDRFSRDTPDSGPTLDADALDVLNERMPMSVLRSVAAHPKLPKSVRSQLVAAILARAVLLGDASTARAILADVRRIIPPLSPSLDHLRAAETDRELLDEGWLVLIAQPGLRPFVPFGTFREPGNYGRLDQLRDNWWCTFHPGKDDAVPYMTSYWTRGGNRLSDAQRILYAGPLDLPAPRFLTTTESHAASEEWHRLVALDTGPTELERHAIDWAERHPNDPRAPHVLAQAVRAGHLGCGDQTTWPLSKRAFTLLHQRYPTSAWAQKTPYWYK